MGPLEALLGEIIPLAKAAGDVVLTEYERLTGDSPTVVHRKADDSPFTPADAGAHRLLSDGLTAVEPRYPVLSEEGASITYEERERWPAFWLIDPLDGTKEFLAGNGEFTVNVALVDGGVPVLGVVHAPALRKTYWAAKAVGAWLQVDGGEPQRVRAARCSDGAVLKVMASRSHAGPQISSFLTAIGNCERESIGSSLKLCRIADGSAHLYPRFGPTMEWDTAAAHCIVREAGGNVTDLAGRELRYNKADLHNPFFVASCDAALAWQRFVTDEIRDGDPYGAAAPRS